MWHITQLTRDGEQNLFDADCWPPTTLIENRQADNTFWIHLQHIHSVREERDDSMLTERLMRESPLGWKKPAGNRASGGLEG